METSKIIQKTEESNNEALSRNISNANGVDEYDNKNTSPKEDVPIKESLKNNQNVTIISPLCYLMLA
jgi:hypothetical protein